VTVAGGSWESGEKRIIALDLLRTAARRRILSLLSVRDGQGSGGLFLRELSRSLRISAATTSYHLQRLEEQGLVKAISTGYRKYFVITQLGKAALSEGEEPSFSASVRVEQVYSTEHDEVVLENQTSRVVVVPQLGSRVVELRCFSIFDFLNRLYPSKAKLPGYEQYGGVEHTLNPFPGIGYLSPFRYEIEPPHLKTVSDLDLDGAKVRYTKTFGLDSKIPLLEIGHGFQNLSESEITFSWSSHPEISIAGSPTGNQVVVPDRQIRKLIFSGNRTKAYLHPSEPWCAASDPATGLIMGQLFPPGTVDRIGIWQDSSYYTVELIIDRIRLLPEEKMEFPTWVIFTRGSEETVRGMCSVLSLGEGLK